MQFFGDSLASVKVALARLNGLFRSSHEMLDILLRTDYPDQIISDSLHEDLQSTVFRQRIPRLFSLKTVKEYLASTFDQNTADLNQLLSLFPRNDFLYYFYNTVDHKWVKRAMGIALPSLPTNTKFNLPLTLFDEFLVPNHCWKGLPWRLLSADFGSRKFAFKDLFDRFSVGKRPADRFSVRLMAAQPIDLLSTLSRPEGVGESLKAAFRRVIFHVHGGGFIAMSSSSHQSYLRKFVVETGAVLFSVDYPLAPFRKYRVILESVFKAYLFVKVLVEQLVGTPEWHFVAVGDSAGANLLAGLTSWTIINGLKRPFALILNYPGQLKSLQPGREPLHSLLPACLRRPLPVLQRPHALPGLLPGGRRRSEQRLYALDDRYPRGSGAAVPQDSSSVLSKRPLVGRFAAVRRPLPVP